MERSYFELFWLYYDDHLIKKKTYTVWTSWKVENYIKCKYLKSTKNQLRSCTMKAISTILIWKFDLKFDWKLIHLLPRMVTIDTKLRIFQCKILNNILFVNKMLFKFRKVESPLCFFCKAEDETYISFIGVGNLPFYGDSFRSFLVLFSIFLVFCHRVPSSVS